MARLSRGWKRLKLIGDVAILVHTTSGKFGTLADGLEQIREWSSMAEAEGWIKAMNEDGAVDALIAESGYHDDVVRLKPIRVRRNGRYWTRMDGSMIPNYDTLFVPDAAVQAALEEKRESYKAAKEALQRLKDEAWDLVRSLKELEH